MTETGMESVVQLDGWPSDEPADQEKEEDNMIMNRQDEKCSLVPRNKGKEKHAWYTLYLNQTSP